MRVLVIEVIGSALVVGGIALFSIPAAIVCAGAFMILFGLAFELGKGDA